jgi:hypothetical protein
MRCIWDELATSSKFLPYLEPKLPEGLPDFQTLQSGDIAPVLLNRSHIIIWVTVID